MQIFVSVETQNWHSHTLLLKFNKYTQKTTAKHNIQKFQWIQYGIFVRVCGISLIQLDASIFQVVKVCYKRQQETKI